MVRLKVKDIAQHKGVNQDNYIFVPYRSQNHLIYPLPLMLIISTFT
jgi:hypothetical protein